MKTKVFKFSIHAIERDIESVIDKWRAEDCSQINNMTSVSGTDRITVIIDYVSRKAMNELYAQQQEESNAKSKTYEEDKVPMAYRPVLFNR